MTTQPTQTADTDEPNVRRVIVNLCDLCIGGAGGECHTPGCILFLNRGPDMQLHPELIEDASTDALFAQVEALRAKLNTPHTADFIEAGRVEAAHQRERWGTEHDAGKADADWFWLVGYLAGKALHALGRFRSLHSTGGDGPAVTQVKEKALHHIITTAAACLNWHAHETGTDTSMRPGIEPPKETP